MAEDHTLLLVALGGKLVALDHATGAIRWEDGLKGGGYGEVALASAHGRVVASALSAKVFCYRYSTGEELWTATTSSMGRASIVIEGDKIFVSKGGEVDCFSLEGAKLWTQALEGKGVGTAAIGFPGNIVQGDDRGTE
jgi:outer membrane protein assembly factor BamB